MKYVLIALLLAFLTLLPTPVMAQDKFYKAERIQQIIDAETGDYQAKCSCNTNFAGHPIVETIAIKESVKEAEKRCKAMEGLYFEIENANNRSMGFSYAALTSCRPIIFDRIQTLEEWQNSNSEPHLDDRLRLDEKK